MMQNMAIAGCNVPIIDIGALYGTNNWRIGDIASEIARACKTTGFFYVVNHGIPKELYDAVFAQARALFALPLEAKQALDISKSPYMRGYFGHDADKSDGVHGDIKEGFDLAADLPSTDPYVEASLPFYGPNVWPPGLPNFRDTLTAYHNSMLRMGSRLLMAFARSLGIEDEFFQERFRKPMAQIRMLRYPPRQSETGYDIGAGEHTDFGWITMIAQDAVGGLEIKDTANQWIPIPHIDDSFVVNVGDLMSRWTNDLYPATLHRVINASPQARYSIAFFMDPDYYARVDCLPTCVSPNRPPRYEPIVVGDYMNRRFYETTTFRDVLGTEGYDAT